MQNFKILLFALLLLESVKTADVSVSVTVTPASTTVGEEPIYDFTVTPSTTDNTVCIKILFDEPTFLGASKGITTPALLGTYITTTGFSTFAVFAIDTTSGLFFTVSVTTVVGTTATMQLPIGSILNPGSAIESTYTVTTYKDKGVCTSTYGTVQTGTINYTPSELVFDTDVYVTLATNPINGDENTMTFTINHKLEIPQDGYVTIQMPKRFVGTTAPIKYLATLDSGYSITSISNTLVTLAAVTGYSLDDDIQPSDADADTLEIKILTTGGLDPDDGPLIIIVDNLNYPYSTNPLTGFIISTQSSDGVDIEQCTDAEIVTTVAGTMTGETMSVSSDTVNDTGVTYTFSAKAVNQIPDGASLWIDYSGSDATHTTTNVCNTDLLVSGNTKMSEAPAGGCTVATATGIVKYDKIWVADDSTGTISIEVAGWTNPPSAATQTFTILIYDVDDTYVIDSVSVTYEFSPVVLVVKTFEPGDGDYGVNSVPDYYDVWIKIQADIESDYQIRITFPVDYYYFDEDTSGCDAENFDIGEADDCTISITTDEDSDDNEFQSEITILIEGFTTTDDTANTNYKFTLSDVRNPFIRFEQIETLMFEILDADDNAVQLGYFTVGKFQVQPSMLSAFTVTAASSKTGVTTSYIVKMEPVGIVPRKATIYLYYPEDVNPSPNRLLKDRCGQSTAEDFPNDDKIACRYRESENLIIIEDGFESWNSQDFPEIEFDLPVVQNPRSTKPTSAFKAEFYDEDMNLIYYWNKTTAPVLKMTSAGPPTQIYFTRLSTQNGNRTTYTFYVKNSQAYDEGDLVTITLPASMNLTANSKCEFLQGFHKTTSCKVSANLQSVYFNSKFSAGRRLNSNGEVGSKWIFEITDVRNPYSLKESASISYVVKTSDGFDIEGESAGLTVTNDEPGLIPYQTAYVLPSTFDRSTKSNYTLYFEPMNFETGMSLTIKIPEDLSIDASDKKFCTGISGVDSTVLDCKWDLKAKTVTFSSAWKLTYYIPKDIQLSFGPIMNPSQKIMTKSFNISTTTADGFALDSLAVNLQVSFSCTFPCATCTTTSDSKCLSCYSKKDFKYLYSQYCYAECPSGTYETDFNTCAKCSPNCLTCETSSNYCTSCESFYYLNKKKNTCDTASFYPFPFIIASFLMTLATSLTILIRRDTKFRESVIALLSWVEIVLWIVCCVLMGGTQQLLIILAVILHLVMNGFFGVVHEKYIFPKADAYYQEVIMTENKKHARFVIITSFIFTFKFHHILLSNFGQSERYSGDFSRESWIIWNKFALVYLLGIYPVSVIAGVLGIMQAEGPLDSFLGIELLVVSGYMSFLLLVCLKTYIGTFGPCARLACCQRYFSPKGDYVPKFRPPQKKEVYDAYGPNDSKAELMDIQKFKSPLQTPGEEQKDDLYPKNLIEEEDVPKEEYQIKVTRRDSERIDQNSDGEQISEPKMLERMQKERKRLKMLKEQLNSEQKLKKNEQTKLIKETKNQVDIKQKTGYKAHGIEEKSSKIQSEHKGLILDRQEFLNEMDRRIEKKLEEWTEIQNIRHLIKRENTQSSLLSNNLKEVSHLASPEKSVYDDDRSGMKNRTQDLHALKNLATDHSQVSPDVNKSRQDPIKSSMKASPYNQGKSSKMDKSRVHDEGSVENQSVHTLKSNKLQRVAPDTRASQEQKFDQAQKSLKSGKSIRQNEPTDEDEVIRREMEENEMIGDQSMPPGDDPRGASTKGASAKDSPLKGSPQKNKSNLGPSLKSGQGQYEDQAVDPATGESLAKTPGKKAVKGAPTRNSQIEPFREDASQGPNAKSMKAVTGNPALDAARGEASVEGGKSEKGRAQGQNRLIDPVTGEPTEDNRTFEGSRKQKDPIAQLAEEADMPIMPEDMRKSQKGVPGKQDPSSQKGEKKDASPLNRSNNDPLNKSNNFPGKSEKSLPGKSEKGGKNADEKGAKTPDQSAKSGGQKKEGKEADRDSLKGDATPPAKKKNKRVVIYSDKSESSIEELMEDTPSNYNIPNGRLDGKSIGLKAIFMHAQKMGISIPDSQVKALEERQKNNLEAVQEEHEAGPKRGNPLNNLTHLMDSSDASWQPGNRRFNGAIDETINSNIDGESVEQFGKKKKAPIQKKFQEPPHNRGGSNQTTLARNSVSKPIPISKNSSKANDEGARSMKKNNFV